jgi:sulfoxide reductase heme-binding subunit YedZ
VSNSVALWYTARATGMVALLLLTASVLLGILGPLRAATPRWPRFTLTLLHRNVALLTAAFLVVHVASSVVDSYAGIGWLDAIVPFGSVYRPFWLGLGAIALDLLAALVVTSLVRTRLGLRAWRAVHWTAYLVWPLAVLHGLGAGTDARGGWTLLVTLGCLAAVVAAASTRLLRASGDPA